MEIEAFKKVKVNAKTLKLHIKVRDMFQCEIADQDGEIIKEYEGYVPGFMPEDHYGDYLILDIDIDSGQVTNWGKVDKGELEDFINNKESE